MRVLRHSKDMEERSKNKSEQSSLSGRIARYSRVSTTMAGLGARLIGEKYLGIEIKKDEHAAQLTQALGNLKGLSHESGANSFYNPKHYPQNTPRLFSSCNRMLRRWAGHLLNAA